MEIIIRKSIDYKDRKAYRIWLINKYGFLHIICTPEFTLFSVFFIFTFFFPKR